MVSLNLLRTIIDPVDENQEELQMLESPPVFALARVDDPLQYVSTTLKEAPETKSLVDFKKGTTTLGFIFQHGVILAADSRASMGSFVASQTCQKILELNPYLLATIAGGAADCAFWGRHLARICRLHELRNNERMSPAAASNILANIFYQYKGYDLSCGMMVAGYNLTKDTGELYYTDDSGSKLKGPCFSVGSGSNYAYGILDTHYKHDLTLEEAVELSKLAIYHATHRDGGSGGVVRVYHIHRNGWTKVEAGLDVMTLHEDYMKNKNVPYDHM